MNESNNSNSSSASSMPDFQTLQKHFEKQKKIKAQMAWLLWFALLSPPLLYFYIANSMIQDEARVTDMNLVISLLALVSLGAVLFYKRMSGAAAYTKYFQDSSSLPVKYQVWLQSLALDKQNEAIIWLWIIPRWFMFSLIAWVVNESVCIFALVISIRLQNPMYSLLFGIFAGLCHILMYPKMNQLVAELQQNIVKNNR